MRNTVNTRIEKAFAFGARTHVSPAATLSIGDAFPRDLVIDNVDLRSQPVTPNATLPMRDCCGWVALGDDFNSHEDTTKGAVWGMVTASGRGVNIYDPVHGTMQFLEPPAGAQEAISIAVAPSRRIIAVCERTRADITKGQISIYHISTKERKTLTFPLAAGEFRLCAFSPDGNYLVAFGGQATDMSLVLWKWRRGKIMASKKLSVPLTRIAFRPVSLTNRRTQPGKTSHDEQEDTYSNNNRRSSIGAVVQDVWSDAVAASELPLDKLAISASGPGYLKLWRPFVDGTMEQRAVLSSHKFELEIFSDHCWLKPAWSVQGRRRLHSASAVVGLMASLGAPEAEQSGNSLGCGVGPGATFAVGTRIAALVDRGLVYILGAPADDEETAMNGPYEFLQTISVSIPTALLTATVRWTGHMRANQYARTTQRRSSLNISQSNSAQYQAPSQTDNISKVSHGSLSGGSRVQMGTNTNTNNREVDFLLGDNDVDRDSFDDELGSDDILPLCLTITATPKGFIVGGEQGFIGVFEATDKDNELLIQSTTTNDHNRSNGTFQSTASIGMASSTFQMDSKVALGENSKRGIQDISGGPPSGSQLYSLLKAFRSTTGSGTHSECAQLRLNDVRADEVTEFSTDAGTHDSGQEESQVPQGHAHPHSALYASDGLHIYSILPSPAADIIVTSSRAGGVRFIPTNTLDELRSDNDISRPLAVRGTHTDPITGLATCIWQPIVATFSCTARCIRVWNYVERRCEIVHYMPQEPTCISMHATGAVLCVGTSTGIWVYNILPHTLYKWKQISLRHVTAVQYSHAGGVIAIASGFDIYIHDAYTLEQICLLRGHIGTIRSLAFAANDRLLASSGDDGAAYVWDLDTHRRIEAASHVLKPARFSSVQLLVEYANKIGNTISNESNLPSATGRDAFSPSRPSGSQFIGRRSSTSDLFGSETRIIPLAAGYSRVGVVKRLHIDSSMSTNTHTSTYRRSGPAPHVRRTSVCSVSSVAKSHKDGKESKLLTENLTSDSIPATNALLMRRFGSGYGYEHTPYVSGLLQRADGHDVLYMRVNAKPDDSVMISRPISSTSPVFKLNDSTQLSSPQPTSKRQESFPLKNSESSTPFDAAKPSTLNAASSSDTVPLTDVVLSVLCIDQNRQFLYAGTSVGTIRAYRLPLVASQGTQFRVSTAGKGIEMDTNAGKEHGEIAGDDSNKGGGNPADQMLALSAAQGTTLPDLTFVDSELYGGSLGEAPFMEWPAHAGGVTGLTLSRDNSYLFSSGEDGVLLVHAVIVQNIVSKGKSTSNANKSKSVIEQPWEPTSLSSFNYLVTTVDRAGLAIVFRRLAAVQSEIEEVRASMLQKLKMREREMGEKAAGMMDQMENTIAAERKRYEDLREKFDQAVREAAQAREKAEANASRTLQSTENEYERKMTMEMERFDRVEEDFERHREETADVLDQVQQEAKRALEQLALSKETMRRELESRIKILERKQEEETHASSLRLQTSEEDYEKEIFMLKEQARKTLEDEKQISAERTNALSKLKKHIRDFKKAAETGDYLVRKKQDEIHALKSQVEQLQQVISGKDVKAEELRSVLKEKEEEIATLKNDIRVLNSWKYVLDHRVEGMQEERQPMMQHVEKLSDQLKSMFDELNQQHKDARSIETDRQVDAMRMKGQEIEMKRLRSRLREKEVYITDFLRELELCVKRTGDGGENVDKGIAAGTRALFNKYVRGEKEAIERHKQKLAVEHHKRRQESNAGMTSSFGIASAMETVGGANVMAARVNQQHRLKQQDAQRRSSIPGNGSIPTGTTTGGNVKVNRPISSNSNARVSPTTRNQEKVDHSQVVTPVTNDFTMDSSISWSQHQEAVSEVVRQREYVKKGATALARQLKSTVTLSQRHRFSSMNENTVLIEECNHLREYVRQQDRELQTLKTQLALVKKHVDPVVAMSIFRTESRAAKSRQSLRGSDSLQQIDSTPIRALPKQSTDSDHKSSVSHWASPIRKHVNVNKSLSRPLSQRTLDKPDQTNNMGNNNDEVEMLRNTYASVAVSPSQAESALFASISSPTLAPLSDVALSANRSPPLNSTKSSVFSPGSSAKSTLHGVTNAAQARKLARQLKQANSSMRLDTLGKHHPLYKNSLNKGSHARGKKNTAQNDSVNHTEEDTNEIDSTFASPASAQSLYFRDSTLDSSRNTSSISKPINTRQRQSLRLPQPSIQSHEDPSGSEVLNSNNQIMYSDIVCTIFTGTIGSPAYSNNRFVR